MSSALFTATRRRLVLWNIAVTGVIIAVFALAAYFVASQVLVGEVDEQLAVRAASVQTYLNYNLSDPDNDHDNDGDVSGVFLVLIRPDGSILQDSLNRKVAGIPNMDAFRATLASGEPDLRTVSVGTDAAIEVRLRTERIMQRGTLVGVLQLGTSTEPYEHQLHMLLMVLTAVGAGELALALCGGIFLASRALVPVRTAFQRQRDFVADASHELRTPLVLIRADIDVLGRELRAARAKLPFPKPRMLMASEDSAKGGLALETRNEQSDIHETAQLDDQLELVDDALGEIDRMTRLLKELLLLARLDGGAIKIPPQPVALTEQLEGVIEQIHRRAEARGLSVQAHLEPHLCVMGNADQLRQLWLILLDNAILYNRPGGTITLTGVSETQQAKLSVTDTGIGIAATDLPRLFERFYRADKAHSHLAQPPAEATLAPSSEDAPDGSLLTGSGAGLGLAIAQGIVQAHAGNLSVQSIPGEGTTFTIRLPLRGQQ